MDELYTIVGFTPIPAGQLEAWHLVGEGEGEPHEAHVEVCPVVGWYLIRYDDARRLPGERSVRPAAINLYDGDAEPVDPTEAGNFVGVVPIGTTVPDDLSSVAAMRAQLGRALDRERAPQPRT